MSVEGWVNWNPDPEVHAFGERIGARPLVVALCSITVRERRGDFDPADPRACPYCAEGVRDGLDRAATTQLRRRDLPPDSKVFVCRR